jgi:hypothetical protein
MRVKDLDSCAFVVPRAFATYIALSLVWLSIACSSDPASVGGSGGPGSGGGAPTAGGGRSGSQSSTSGGGSAGSLSGGGAGTSGSSGAGGAGTSSSGGAGSAGTSSSGEAGGAVSHACPADATFCSGFEAATLPAGAVYKANAAPGDWSRDFEVDATLFHSGRSSLRVKSDSEAGISGAYRMLAVPAPEASFWVRFYVQQTELDIGGNEHNVFASASGSDDPNASSVELAEDVGVAFNAMDSVRWPTNYGRTTAGGLNPFSLPKGIWHCIEISYDSKGREQKLFINGVQQIDATDYPSAASLSTPFKIFKFGFNQLHGPSRKVWYDDVVVGPTRSNCY